MFDLKRLSLSRRDGTERKLHEVHLIPTVERDDFTGERIGYGFWLLFLFQITP